MELKFAGEDVVTLKAKPPIKPGTTYEFPLRAMSLFSFP